MRSTSDWAALLDGTTEGPWKFEERDVWEHTAGLEYPAEQVELEHSVQDENGNHLFGAFNNYTMIEHPGNLPLAAAAPEAVAEVVRLRRELEAMRDGLEWNGTQVGADQNEQAQFEAHGEVARALTRILEGGARE